MTSNKKRKILVVDDVEQNRMILSEILKDDYTVIEADDGDVCLKKLREDKDIILVLLDIVMPKMDGFQVLREMSKDKELQHKSVIITTADRAIDAEIRALRDGAVDFLEKPYNSDIVKCRVDNIVTRIVLESEILEEKLDLANERLAAMVNLIPDGIAIFDYYESGRVDLGYYNEYFANIFNITRSIADTEKISFESLNQLFELDLIYPGDRSHLEEKVKKCIDDSGTLTCQFRIKRNGAFSWVRMSMITFLGSNGVCRCHVLFSDISSEKDREEQITDALNKLRYVTRHDKLTQIYNRETFCASTDKLLSVNPSVKYSIIMWDIKNFKVINELFGSDKGDKILILIADTLKSLVGNNGIYGRMESDKFVVCIPASLCDINSIINKMDMTLNSANIVDYNLKIFSGIYNIINDEKIPIDQMCDRANMALKSAKRDYVNRYSYYDSEMRKMVMEEELILNDMDTALQNQQFKVCYQPIFSVTSGKPIAAEALVRWMHPDRGVISPQKFITVFENNKFITKLDWCVLEEVCKFQKKRLDAGKVMLPISVNFSRLDCYKPMICENVLGLIEQYGLSPDMIKIEITETAYTMDKEQIIDVTNKFRSYGFQVLMDDFGSGYSSLNTLKDVNIDILKIDKRFIDDIEDSDKAGAIVSSVVRMARLIGMDIIAEGVETQYQKDFLRGIGCDTIQGYFYSKPLFENEFNEVIDKYSKLPIDKCVSDIRANDLNVESIWSGNKEVDALFGGLIGAMGMYELNPNGVLEIIRVNDGYYDLFGSSPGSVYSDLGLSFSRLEDESKDLLLNACSRAKYENQIINVELKKYHEDGHLMWLSCRVKHIGKSDNRDLFYILINDITEQKMRDTSRQISVYADMFKSFFNEIFEINTINKTVTVMYTDGRIGFETGMKFDIDTFMNFCRSNLADPKDYSSLDKNIKQSFENAPVFVDTYKVLDIDGNARWYECRVLKVNGSDLGIYLCCSADITEEKNIALSKENMRIAEHVNEEKKRLFAVLSRLNICVFELDLKNDVFIMDEQTEYEFNNFFGDICSISGFVNKTFGEDKNAFDSYLSKVKNGIFDSGITVRILMNSGEYGWFKLDTVRQTEKGEVKKIIGTIQKVDESLTDDIGIIREKEQLVSMLNSMQFGVGIFEYDSDSLVPKFYNNRLRELLEIFDGSVYTSSPYVNDLLVYISNVCGKYVNDKNGVNINLSEEHEYKCRDGSKAYANLSITIISFSKNKMVVYCVIDDITNRIEAENKFKEQGYVNSILVETSEYIILDYNAVTKSLTISMPVRDGKRKEYEYKDINSLSSVGWVYPEYLESIDELLFRENYSEDKKDDSIELLANIGGCGYRWHQAVFHYVPDSENKIVRVIGRISDIQIKKERELALSNALNEREKLLEKAEIDSVTGLLNRLTTEECIENKLSKIKSESAFVVYDIDNYEDINADLGHIKAEDYLKKVASVFEDSFRHGDIIGRMDSDVFVAFLTDVKAKDGVYNKVGKTMAKICLVSEEFGFGKMGTVSAGIAFSPDNGVDFMTLYKKANMALCKAKKSGGNSYTIYSEV